MAAAAPQSTETTNYGSLQLKQTRRGKVYVGELSAEFLRIPPPQPPMGGQMPVSQQQMYTHPHAMVTSHRLTVTVIEAKLNKGYGMTKMDPYCRLRVGHGIFETPTATSAGKTPYWGKTWSSIVNRDLKSIDVEVFDERAFSTDSRIAWGSVVLSQDVKKGKSEDDWWPLSGKLGDEKEGAIHLQITMKKEQRPAYPQIMMPQMMMQAPGYVIPPGIQIGGMGMAPAPRPHPPPITEEDVRQMKEMFPNTDDDVIKTVLDASGGNKDAAINSLLAMQ